MIKTEKIIELLVATVNSVDEKMITNESENVSKILNNYRLLLNQIDAGRMSPIGNHLKTIADGTEKLKNLLNERDALNATYGEEASSLEVFTATVSNMDSLVEMIEKAEIYIKDNQDYIELYGIIKNNKTFFSELIEKETVLYFLDLTYIDITSSSKRLRVIEDAQRLLQTIERDYGIK